MKQGSPLHVISLPQEKSRYAGRLVLLALIFFIAGCHPQKDIKPTGLWDRISALENDFNELFKSKEQIISTLIRRKQICVAEERGVFTATSTDGLVIYIKNLKSYRRRMNSKKIGLFVK